MDAISALAARADPVRSSSAYVPPEEAAWRGLGRAELCQVFPEVRPAGHEAGKPASQRACLPRASVICSSPEDCVRCCLHQVARALAALTSPAALLSRTEILEAGGLGSRAEAGVAVSEPLRGPQLERCVA